MEISLKPMESLLFSSDLVAIGKFRCPAAHPLYKDSGPCSTHTFVFPRTITRIRHDDGQSFVGSPNSVSLYNRNQRYNRVPISPSDDSDWFVIAPDVMLEMMAGFDPAVMDRPERPFREIHVSVDASTYLAQRRLFERLQSGETLDPLLVEETALSLFSRVLRALFSRRRPAAARIDVEAVKTLIARNPPSNLSLRRIAAALGSTPYQVCRAFRATTGMTLTQYRHALRVRMSLARLRSGKPDLTELALDLGYSSHSHFTAVFRRHFGVTPSQFRNHALKAEDRSWAPALERTTHPGRCNRQASSGD